MLRVAALEQPDVQGQAGGLRELVQKAGREIPRETCDVRLREVDVRDDERPTRRFQDDVCQRLVRGCHGRPVPPHACRAQLLAKRLPKGLARGRHLRVGPFRRELQFEVESGVAGEQAEQMVEDR